jgi:hypothetical protein
MNASQHKIEKEIPNMHPKGPRKYNDICGNVMLFMNLDLIVSLLLWGSDSIGYQR